MFITDNKSYVSSWQDIHYSLANFQESVCASLLEKVKARVAGVDMS